MIHYFSDYMKHLPADSPEMKDMQSKYGKCPKILYTKVSDKMTYADSADTDQTAA